MYIPANGTISHNNTNNNFPDNRLLLVALSFLGLIVVYKMRRKRNKYNMNTTCSSEFDSLNKNIRKNMK